MIIGDKMKIGYVRVSSLDQNEERQLVTMKKYKVEKVFIEKMSAKDKNRPKLQEMLDYVRDGDTIIVHDLSRLARNTKDLLEIVEYFKNGMKNPNEIFEIYEELSKLSEDEIAVYRQSGIGDAIAMKYITAVEMKKKGTWNDYLNEWEKKKIKQLRNVCRNI